MNKMDENGKITFLKNMGVDADAAITNSIRIYRKIVFWAISLLPVTIIS